MSVENELACSILPILSYSAGALPHVILGGDLNCLPETGAARPLFAPCQYCPCSLLLCPIYRVARLRHLDLSSRTSKVQLLLNGEAIVTIAWFLDLTRRSSVVHRWRVTMVIGRHLHRPMVLWKTVEPRMIHFGFRYILPHFTVFYLYECIVFSHYSLCLSFCQCHTCLPFGSSHGEMRMLRMMRPMGWREAVINGKWMVWFMKKT